MGGKGNEAYRPGLVGEPGSWSSIAHNPVRYSLITALCFACLEVIQKGKNTLKFCSVSILKIHVLYLKSNACL